MVTLKVIAVILASIVVLDRIEETGAGWVRVRAGVSVRIGKRSLDLFCPQVYGIACKTAKVEIEKRPNIDISGSECKVASRNVCENQKRELSPITADGLKYVPLPPDFGFYDTNKDGKIAFEEFAAQILPRYPIHDSASLKTMFDAADTDGDGGLGSDEFSVAPFVQVTLRTGGEDIPNENERNAIEDESKYGQSQTSENEA